MQTLGSVAVGSIVKIKENGSPVDFYVAKHDYESGLNGAGRTLVVRKDTYDNRVWDAGNVNAYASSDLDSWFNSTYKNMLDADIRSLIGTTKIRYTPGNGNNTVTTLERAIFALSLTELGQSASWVNVEGSALPIASTLRIAYWTGSATTQWTRSPNTTSTSNAVYLGSDGNVYGNYCIYSNGSRPAFTLPGTSVYVDDSGNVVPNQPPTAPGTITVPSAGSKGGSLTVSWTASTDPDGNLSGYTLQRMVDSGSWTQVYQGANTSFTDTLPATANSVQYRVQAYDAAGATSDWTTSSSVPVYGSPKLTVPIQAMQGQQVSMSWTEIDGADSYLLQRKASTDSDFTQVYAGTALTFNETAGTWTAVQYRVCAVFGSTNGAWATSGSIPVVSASALVVSGSDGDLGTLTSDVEYTVSSDGTNPITVEEDVNGTVRTFTAVNGGTNVIPVVDLPTGTGTITIKATTQATAGDVTVTRSWTYAKGAPVFSDSGSLAQLQQQGADIWPKTIAEAIRTPGIWGGNLGLALSKLAGSVVYNATQQPKYAEVTVSLAGKSEGDVIQLPENGQMVDFYVAKLDYESGLNGTGRVLLVRKDCYDQRAWDAVGVNAYASSDIDAWFNGTYKALFPQDIQTAMGTTKFYYTPGNGNNTVTTLERAVFALSATELGQSESWCNSEGSALPIASTLQVAHLNGSPTDQWTRSPRTSGTGDAAFLYSNGDINSVNCSNSSYGSRPVFTLPSTFTGTYYVANDGTIMDEQEYVPAGSFEDVQGNAVPVTRMETGSYVGTGTYGEANPNSLTFGFEPLVVFISDVSSSSAATSYYNFGFMNNSQFGIVRNYSNAAGAFYIMRLSWSERGLSFYSDSSPLYQLNMSGTTYNYVAIGLGGAT